MAGSGGLALQDTYIDRKSPLPVLYGELTIASISALASRLNLIYQETVTYEVPMYARVAGTSTLLHSTPRNIYSVSLHHVSPSVLLINFSEIVVGENSRNTPLDPTIAREGFSV